MCRRSAPASSRIILATDPARKADLEAEIARRDQAADTAVEAIRAGDTDGQQRDPLTQLTQALANYRRVRDSATLPASRAGNNTAALASYGNEEAARQEAIGGALDALITSKATVARETKADLTTRYETARRLVIGATAAGPGDRARPGARPAPRHRPHDRGNCRSARKTSPHRAAKS